MTRAGETFMTIRLPPNLERHVRDIARDRRQNLSQFVRSILWDEVRRKRKVCDKCEGAGVVALRQTTYCEAGVHVGHIPGDCR